MERLVILKPVAMEMKVTMWLKALSLGFANHTTSIKVVIESILLKENSFFIALSI